MMAQPTNTRTTSHGLLKTHFWYAAVASLLIVSSVPFTQARRFSIPSAAVAAASKHSAGKSLSLVSGIFGFGNDNSNNKNEATTKAPPPPATQSFGRSASASLPPHLRNRNHPPYPSSSSSGSSGIGANPTRRPPPPPPPPRVGAATQTTSDHNQVLAAAASALEGTNQTGVEEEASSSAIKNLRPPPPPALPQWGMAPGNQQLQQQASPPQQMMQTQGWMKPPPGQYEDQWQSSVGGGPDAYYHGEDYLRSELEESYQREGNLIAELDNMTAAIVVMEQREELHIRQLDVLTERVMDVEAQAAEDRNLLVTYEANCTALGRTVATLQEELEDWQKRCKEFAARHDTDQEKLNDLKRLIKDKESEAEEIAIAIENVRLAEKRRESSQSRRKGARRGGLFSWILGFFVTTDPDYDEAMRQEAYELAKSTLLRALQSERGNVHELEAAVMSLQQNNSAISEMVESRDSIIDELNNRIAVFEEDKVVLKAALRQLQKEIKEEAPKAQKLMDDLAKAEQEIKRLKSEMNTIIETHQDEIIALQDSLSTKQKAISETESNLTAIGTYVDRLEERLTSFAVTRRDMEEREKKCKQIEEAAILTENERNALQEKVDEYSKEQSEVKKLLEELAVERTTLQKENRKLYTEREFRIAEQEQLQTRCASLENTTKTLQDELDQWKSRNDNLLPELEAARASGAELQSRLEAMQEMEHELEASRRRCTELESDLSRAGAGLEAEQAEKEKLAELVRNQTLALAEYEKNAIEAETTKPTISSHHEINEGRDVPFRKLRKQLSKATGIHGLLTAPSQAEAIGRFQSKQPVMKEEGQKKLPPPPPRSGPPPLPKEAS